MSKPLKCVPEINGLIRGWVNKNAIHNSRSDKLQSTRHSINETRLDMSTSFRKNEKMLSTRSFYTMFLWKVEWNSFYVCAGLVQFQLCNRPMDFHEIWIKIHIKLERN